MSTVVSAAVNFVLDLCAFFAGANAGCVLAGALEIALTCL